MKTFKNFLTEEIQNHDIILAVAKKIKAECAEWLQKSGGRLVYRGTKNRGEVISLSDLGFDQEEIKDFTMHASREFSPEEGMYIRPAASPPSIAQTRKNRLPKDSREVTHHALNDALEKAFGKKFRSEAVFASPSEEVAQGYGGGRVFAIFPRGECNFIWSHIILDAFSLDGHNDMFSILKYSKIGLDNEAEYIGIIKSFIKQSDIEVHQSFLDFLSNILQVSEVKEQYTKNLTKPSDQKSQDEKEFDESYKELSQRSVSKDFISYLLSDKIKDLYSLNKKIPAIKTEVMIVCDDYIMVPSSWATKLHSVIKSL